MVAFERSTRALAGLAALVVSACTFESLGDYEIKTCARPVSSKTVQQVGQLASSRDFTFTSASGANAIAAFSANVTGGVCIQGIGTSGYLDSECSFLTDERTRVPRQPSVVSLGAGHAAAIVASTAPCTTGKLLYRFTRPGVAVGVELECGVGVALPSIAPASNDARAVVAWYAAPVSTRADALGGCAAAAAAPLMVAAVDGADGATPSFSLPKQLAVGTSVRPPAVVPSADKSNVIVASPAGGDVSVWTVDGALAVSIPSAIPGLAGARAVSIAVAGDGSGRIAVVAEIGCAPQSLRLAVGTIAGGFSTVAEVAPQGVDAAAQPSAAWVSSRGEWLVSWISTSGTAHALARRFTADGQGVGGTIDHGIGATAAMATSDGDIFAFAPQANGDAFMDVVLGCTP